MTEQVDELDVSVDKTATDLRWSVAKRLEFIEFRLFWYGRFNRSDLASTFSVSNQQASADIAEYERQAPGNLIYARGEKAYLRTDEFKPHFLQEKAERYLLQVMAIKNGWMAKSDSWFDALPPMEVVGLPVKSTDAMHLLRILDAIRNRLEIDVVYHSLNGSSPNETRTLAPHALMQAGDRSYFRAWARARNDFRDYNINRVIRIDASRPTEIDPQLDFEWQHSVDLQIAPNPNLPEEKRRAVENEHGLQEGGIILKSCRLSLVFYLMDKYNLDVDPGSLKPEKQQLVLLNAEEVKQAQKTVRMLSRDALSRSSAS